MDGRTAPRPAAPVASAPAPTSQGPDLKYLGFFRAAALEIYFFILQIYQHLKEKSGSFKPGIESVEGNVKTIVGPVISRVKFEPDEYLKFVDTKVDGTLQFAQDYVPEEWKRQAVASYELLLKVPEKTQAAVDEYNQKGALATAQSYYDFYLPIALAYAAAFWSFLMTLPFVPQLVEVSQPYAFCGAQQYNRFLLQAQKCDIALVKSISEYLPAIPLEKLKKTQ